MGYGLSALYLGITILAGLGMVALGFLGNTGPIWVPVCLAWLVLFLDAVSWWAARQRRRLAPELTWALILKVLFAAVALSALILTLREGTTARALGLGHFGYLGWAACTAWFYFNVRIVDPMLLGDLVRAWKLERPKIQIANLYSLLMSAVVLADVAALLQIGHEGVTGFEGAKPEVLLGFMNGVFLVIYLVVGPIIPMIGRSKRIVGANCFLSYATEDAEFVNKLQEGLEARHLQCFHDRRHVLGGDELAITIGRGIASSDVFLVVLSESSLASQWVRDETLLALHYERMYGAPTVIPMRICSMDAIDAWKSAGDDVSAKIRGRSIVSFGQSEAKWEASLDQLGQMLTEKAASTQ
jgi:hypothetical protein